MSHFFSMDRLRQLFAGILFPEYNACHLCGRFPEKPGLLCDACQTALNKWQLPKRRMAAYRKHPPLTVCLAAFPHRKQIRQLIHLFKYESDCAAAPLLGEYLNRVLTVSRKRLPDVDAVIPVPLHTSRLEERGYNQAHLLAQEICQRTDLPLVTDALIRVHPTDTQLHRDRVQRMQAMQHAFAVKDPQAVSGRHVLLVDDVLTTGATATACAAELLNAGAASVSLITVCRA